MDIVRTLVVVLAAGHLQHVLLGGDVDLVAREAGDRKGDAEAIVVELYEVERRIVFARLARRIILEQIEQAIEADGRAPERAKSTARRISRPPVSEWRDRAARDRPHPGGHDRRPRHRTHRASGSKDFGIGARVFKTLGDERPERPAGAGSRRGRAL